MIPKETIQNYLAHIPKDPHFKGAREEVLINRIEAYTGVPYRPKAGPPWKHQLEGLAFSLWAEQCLILYWMRLGKALSSDCPVASPSGWRPIGELRPGDLIIGRDGRPTKVTGVFPQGKRPMFRVHFSDGSSILADDNHLWEVTNPRGRWLGYKPEIKSTKELRHGALYNPSTKGWNWSIPLVAPVDYPTKELPIDPYTLGVLIGDGAFGLNVSSPHKRIPPEYLTASIEQRRSLLAGLLDTDGWVQGSKSITTLFSTSSEALAMDVKELVLSLGGLAYTTKKKAGYKTLEGYKECLPAYSMTIRFPPEFGCPFRIPAKVNQWRPLKKFVPRRSIIKITRDAPADAVCIAVEAEDQLFVVSDYIVTHNTRIACEWMEMLRRAGRWNRLGLVIAHAPIGLQVWEEQIKQYSDLKARFVQNSLDEFMDAMDDEPDIIVTPWSGLQNMFTFKAKDKKGKTKLFPDWDLIDLASEQFDLCVMDEIHYCKNHHSLRFGIASKLTALCEFRMGLTGTPIARSGYALWAQSFLIDRGETLGRNFYFFQQAFGKKKKSPFTWSGVEWKFDRRKLPLLRRKIADRAMTYELNEVRKTDIQPGVVKLRMGGEQLEKYNEIIRDVIVLQNSETVEIANQFVRLRQVSSGWITFPDKKRGDITLDLRSNAKLEWFHSFLDGWDGKMPFVVFHDFTHTGAMLSHELTQRKINHSWFYGGTKDPDRELMKFRSGAVKVFVANTTKGGTGIDLSMADYLLFFECPLSPVSRAQAEARPLAASRGRRPLLMDDLVCSPVEERILMLLREGRNASKAIYDRASLMAGAGKT